MVKEEEEVDIIRIIRREASGLRMRKNHFIAVVLLGGASR